MSVRRFKAKHGSDGQHGLRFKLPGAGNTCTLIVNEKVQNIMPGSKTGLVLLPDTSTKDIMSSCCGMVAAFGYIKIG